MHSTEKKSRKGEKLSPTFKKVIRKESVIAEKSITLKAEEPQVRYLKLKEFIMPRKSRKEKIVPELRLCGVWFEQAGFTASEYVSVTVMNGLLVIRPTEEGPNNNNICT